MRRPVLFILSLGLLLVFLGCSRPSPLQHRLEQLDSLVDEHPDSVLRVLETLADSVDAQPDAVRMRYALLKVKAEDKADIIHTDDSLILSVAQYYERHTDERLTPEALYYVGRVHADMGDAPQALDDFQKALDACGDRATKDILHIRCVGCSQMGTLYMMQLMYEEALIWYKEAYRWDEMARDTVGLIYGLRDLGGIYSLLKEYEKADSVYTLAERMLKVYEDDASYARVAVSKAAMYARLGRSEKALQYAFSGLPLIQPPYRGGVYHTIAEAYHRADKLDSAEFFYERAYKEGNIFARESASKGLAEIALLRNNYEKASKWFDRYVLNGDSARTSLQSELLSKMQHVYNYELKAKETHRLQDENSKKMHLIIMLSALLLLIILMTYILHIRYKHHKFMQQMRYKQLKGQKEAIFKKSKELIKKNKERIAQLEGMLDASKQQSEEYQHQLQLKKEELLAQNVYIQKLLEHDTYVKEQVEKSDVFQMVQTCCTSGKLLRANEWEMVELYINSSYPDFLARLNGWNWMSEVEKRVCLLMKLGISSANIAVAISKERSAVSQIKRRLFKKVNGVDGNASAWDEFLASL